MNKILIEINTKIYISYCDNTLKQDNLTDNTSNLKKIIFTEEYLNENKQLIEDFINHNIQKQNVKIIAFDTHLLAYLFLNSLNLNINNIEIKEEAILPQKLYELLLTKKINTITIHNIDKEHYKKLTSQDIVVNIKDTKNYISKLMLTNDFHTYNDLYNATTITIDFKLTKYEIEDITNFLSINQNLKHIYLEKYSLQDTQNILKILKRQNKKHITIFLTEDAIKDIKPLKKLKKKYKIKLKIIYSNEYKKKNKPKKIISIIIIAILIIIIISTVIYLLSFLKDKQAEEKLSKKIKNYKENINTKLPTTEENENEDVQEETAYTKNYSKVISELQKINDETVGWITVNNTKVDYPVVQHNDNSYYLSHDFEKQSNRYGWIFMDYRNNPDNLDKNTILYGHDSSTVMFATLYRTVKQNWYTNKKNQTITFNTANNDGKWQIFSIYKIDTTNDYLTTTFQDTNTYSNFLTKITDRSIYNFNAKPTTNDKILTLSTCYGTKQRLVIHAKKIN